MCLLFEKAEIALKTSVWCWNRGNINKSYVDFACYNMQQSIELSLRVLHSTHNLPYEKDSNIESLLNTLLDTYKTADWYLILTTIAGDVNLWENYYVLNCHIDVTYEIYSKAEFVAEKLLKLINNRLSN